MDERRWKSVSKKKPNVIKKFTMTYRSYNPDTDEPANGWSGEMIRHALQQGKTLVVDQNGDVWTYNEWGHVCDYVGKVRCL